MTNTDPQRITELRALMADFLRIRFENKRIDLENDLEKLVNLAPGHPKCISAEIATLKRAELDQQFIQATWIEDAARRVSQIQAVTHSLKPIHPDAKGSSLYRLPHAQQVLPVMGSHCLGNDFASDVVGNAAALDVYKFLKLEHHGRSLLTLALENDANLAAALSNDPAKAQAWISAFAGLIEPRGLLTSHTLAKQVYWPVAKELNKDPDQDPHNQTDFHLLAPLYASSLTHRVYQTVKNDRFSEEAKAAWEAKKRGEYNERPVREYPQLAIQKLGGTKPQNISQLNSERGGDNFLFASLPPAWRSIDLKPLLGTDTMFHRFGRRPEVCSTVKALVAFLKTDPTRNLATRESRVQWVNDLTDEFLQFSAELRSLIPGWSQGQECRLSNAEKHWLDPDGVEEGLATGGLPLPTDTAERVSALFANWLNAQLRGPLPIGDPEYLEWRNQMYEQIKAEEREAQA